MPVNGRELATLDFANLIGGPLNAVVEAQAKSAITTANFIREVAFDKSGKVINVDFTYNRTNDEGKDQEFSLTVPLLTMLPVPYISVSRATIEFNAKITSINEKDSSDNFDTEHNLEVKSGWFVSAKLNSKVSYQKKSSTSEKEERTFDMHVLVEASNIDMPAGTERILTILEQAITERKGAIIWMTLGLGAKDATDPKKYTVSEVPDNFSELSTTDVPTTLTTSAGIVITVKRENATGNTVIFSTELPPGTKAIKLKKTAVATTSSVSN